MGAKICYIDVKLKRKWQDSDVITDIGARKVDTTKADGVDVEGRGLVAGEKGKEGEVCYGYYFPIL